MDENRHVEWMPQTIGRYQVQASIGFGAMGAVYKAFDPLIKRTLAIKTIRLDIPKGSPQYKSFLDRFHHEARISGTLSHPNIVTLFDIGEEQGIPFLAMEYVEGETIASMLEKGTRFDPERVIGLVSQVAAAIDYAHSRGVIHRDIKPSNLILSEGDRVKVTDFGIAKLADAEMTQSGALLGTPSYMSPEQAMGDKLDGRSDIFSLGICAFEMLSGEQPFPGNNVTSILYKLVHVDPVEPPNLEMNGLVPQKWHEVFGKVLAKKPDDRYQTASEFVQDLEYCLGSWFGSAMGDEATPPTVIMNAAAVAAATTPTPVTPNPGPRPKPAPAPAPAVSVAEATPRSGASPVPTEEPTVVMRVPTLPRSAEPPASDEPATVLMKSPVAEDATARYATRALPKSPPPIPPIPSRPPVPPVSPATEPVARPPLPTPAPTAVRPSTPTVPPPVPPSAPAARRPSAALPLMLVGGGALALLALGGVAVWKLVGGAAPEAPATPAPTPVAVKTAEPTSPPTPVAVTAPGVIGVESDPAGALISIDGEPRGVTPVELAGISLGRHEVRVEMSGYESQAQVVELTAEAPHAKVTLALAPPAATSSVAEIVSTPAGAAVTIAGKVVGTTPVTGLELKPGTYRIGVRKEGYEVFTATLRVVAGRPARLEAPLKAVAVATEPPSTPKPQVVDVDRVFDENEVDTPPKKTKGPGSPDYPDNAPKLKSGESVSVAISWIVTEDGDITDPKIVESAGKAVDEAALKMLRAQRYQPAVKKGRPVKVRLTRKYTFRSG